MVDDVNVENVYGNRRGYYTIAGIFMEVVIKKTNQEKWCGAVVVARWWEEKGMKINGNLESK